MSRRVDAGTLALGWALTFAVGLAAVCCFGCKTPTSETVKVLDQTLDTLTEHGVDYDFEISGQMEGEVWARQAFGAGTPGWVRIRVRSPNMNPMANSNGG